MTDMFNVGSPTLCAYFSSHVQSGGGLTRARIMRRITDCTEIRSHHGTVRVRNDSRQLKLSSCCGFILSARPGDSPGSIDFALCFINHRRRGEGPNAADA